MQVTSYVVEKCRVEKLSFMFGVMFFRQREIYGDNFQRRETQSGMKLRKL
jgi:hypothetical protein